MQTHIYSKFLLNKKRYTLRQTNQTLKTSYIQTNNHIHTETNQNNQNQTVNT